MRSREQRQIDRLAARAPRIHVGPQAKISLMNTGMIQTLHDGAWRWTGERWERL